jgi:crossover junction endodeoxyribonuclease RuvC
MMSKKHTQLVGLDISLTSTGIATEDGEFNVFTVPAKFDHPQARYDYILNEIVGHLAALPVVAIEGYAFAKQSSHAHAQGELGGIVRRYLWQNRISFVEIPPTSLKKFVTGKGNSNKTDMVSSVTLRTGREWAGKGADDRVDAWGLRQMLMVAYHGKGDYDWHSKNLEALDKLDFTVLG